MCKCTVDAGGGDVLPTEVGHLSRTEQKEKVRLSCQVKVKNDMEIHIPEEIFGIKKWEATVVRNYNVASFIKEFVVELPEEMDYKAGGYIQIEVPTCEVDSTLMSCAIASSLSPPPLHPVHLPPKRTFPLSPLSSPKNSIAT